LILLRWNNYGIALLGQQQYLAPRKLSEGDRYRPGYVMAILILLGDVFQRWWKIKGNYRMDRATCRPAIRKRVSSTLGLICCAKALRRRPGDCQALYFEGLLLRHQGRLNEAIELQKQVIASFRGRVTLTRSWATVTILMGDYKAGPLRALNRCRISMLMISRRIITFQLFIPSLAGRGWGREGALYAKHREDPR